MSPSGSGRGGDWGTQQEGQRWPGRQVSSEATITVQTETRTGEPGAEGEVRLAGLGFPLRVEGQAPSGSCGMWQRARAIKATVGRACNLLRRDAGAVSADARWLLALHVPFFFSSEVQDPWSLGQGTRPLCLLKRWTGLIMSLWELLHYVIIITIILTVVLARRQGIVGQKGACIFPLEYFPAFSVGFPPVWMLALDGDHDIP